MNKTYQIPAILLLIIAVTATGCADNTAVSKRYAVEKKFHEAERALEKANIRPELTTPEVRADVRRLYSEAADLGVTALDSVDEKRFPVEYHEVQHLAFQATRQLAKMYYFDHMYDQAIIVLERLLHSTDLQPLQIVATQVNLGRSFQASKQWDSALVLFEQAIGGHYPPLNEDGEILLTLFNLPAHIFRVEQLAGDSAQAALRLDWALEYYEGIVEEFPNSKLERAALGNLARLYDQTGKWQKEIDQLSRMLDSTSSSYTAVRIKIADLYGTKIKQFSTALKLYDELTTELEGTDSIRFAMVQHKIATVKMEQGAYTEARRICADLKENYRRYFGSSPSAQYLIARAFELEGNWSRAEVEYNYLIETYRGSDEALSAFLYVAEHLRNAGRQAEAERWYEGAQKYYQEVAAASPGTIIEARALAYQAELYAKREDWPQTAERLRHLFDRFPTTEPGRRALLRASSVYRNQLGDAAGADSLLDILRASITEIIGAQEK